MAAAADSSSHGHNRRPGPGPLAPRVALPCEGDSSAKARSRADWKRSVAFFSRQRLTIRSSAGGTAGAASSRSFGSSFRIAFIVSTARRPLERAAAAEHLVEDRAEREEIRAVIRRPAEHLLGRHVAHRAEDGPRLGQPCLRFRRSAARAAASGRQLPRQPEVEDLDAAVLGHEQVVGLEIAVHDALVVRGGQALRDLRGELDALPARVSGPAAIRSRSVWPSSSSETR